MTNIHKLEGGERIHRTGCGQKKQPVGGWHKVEMTRFLNNLSDDGLREGLE